MRRVEKLLIILCILFTFTDICSRKKPSKKMSYFITDGDFAETHYSRLHFTLEGAPVILHTASFSICLVKQTLGATFDSYFCVIRDFGNHKNRKVGFNVCRVRSGPVASNASLSHSSFSRCTFLTNLSDLTAL